MSHTIIEAFRREMKYVVPISEFYRIRPMLEACLSPDPHSKLEGYDVRSLYFDSYLDGDLFDVLDGLYNKQKIRLRVYPPKFDTAKLEFKCKSGVNGLKRSLTLTRREAEELTLGRYDLLSFQEEDLAKELYGRMKKDCYQPRVVVNYKRIAFWHALNEIRVTFDYQVAASLDPKALFWDGAPFEPVMRPGIGVLEIKYNGFLPTFVKTAVSKVNMLPMANSKYVGARLLL